MNIVRSIAALAFLFHALTYTASEFMTLDLASIARSSNAWAQTHLTTLNPLQLQLLASNLHLLHLQAQQSAQLETTKQYLIWSMCEIIQQEDMALADSIPTYCIQCTELKGALEHTNNALASCTAYIDNLEDANTDALYHALEAVAEMGRDAFSQYDDMLYKNIQQTSTNLMATIQELMHYPPFIEKVASLSENPAPHEILSRFYALNDLTSRTATRAFDFINISINNSLHHIELMKTCVLIFEICLSQTIQYMNNQELPAEYRHLLFIDNTNQTE